MTSVEILTVRIIFVVLITALIVYGIFKLEREYRENKMSQMSRELDDLIFKVFLDEVKYFLELLKVQKTANMKIKAIFDHLGVKVEIIEDQFTPSIDTFRSLSFMKEYLPEIDEQLRIYQEAEREMNKLDTIDKRHYVILQVHTMISPNMWMELTYEQKREIIHKLSEEYDVNRNQNEAQENLTE